MPVIQFLSFVLLTILAKILLLLVPLPFGENISDIDTAVNIRAELYCSRYLILRKDKRFLLYSPNIFLQSSFLHDVVYWC